MGDMPILEGVAAAIAVAVGKQIAADSDLVPGVAKAIGSAGGGTLQKRVADYLGGEDSRGAINSALSRAAAKVKEKHPDFERRGGGFSIDFLEAQAATELAKSFIVGDEPDPAEIVQGWTTWLISSNDAERFVQVAPLVLPAARTLVAEWDAAIAASDQFRDITKNRDLRRMAEAQARIERALGAAAAGSAERFEYLRHVLEEHRYLDNAGTQQEGAAGRLPLQDVFVTLSSGVDHTPDHAERLAFDALQAELEDRHARGDLSAVDLETEIDGLYAAARQGRTGDDPRERTGEVGILAAEHRSLVVLGDPGAGKTTLVKWLALMHATAALLRESEVVGGDADDRNEPWSMRTCFPIYVRAGALTDMADWKTRSLTEFLVENHIDRDYHNPGSLEDLFDKALSAGECLVILDGMDEIPTAQDRRDVAKRVRSFADRWSSAGNRFIVTSRFAGYRSAPVTGFDHFQVLDMGDQEIRLFLQRYCLAVEKMDQPTASEAHLELSASQRVDAIVEAIESNPGIRRMAVNPLLLTILVLVQRNSVKIPNQRSAAYEAAVKALEEGWRTSDHTSMPGKHLLRTMLVALAAWTHQNRPTGLLRLNDIVEAIGSRWAQQHDITLEEAGEWPPSLLDEVERFVRHVARHNGLLVERAPERWGFLHQTFQEFYVARSMLATSEPARAIRNHLHDPRYDEPILLALGIATHVEPRDDAADLFEAALLGTGPATQTDPDFYAIADFEDLLDRSADFAIRSACDDVQVAPHTLRRLGTEFARQIVQIPVWDSHRLREVVTPARTTKLGSIAAEALRDIATDTNTDSFVRSMAAQALGQLGDTSTEPLRGVARHRYRHQHRQQRSPAWLPRRWANSATPAPRRFRRCETSLPTPTPTATFAASLPRRWANSATPAPRRFRRCETSLPTPTATFAAWLPRRWANSATPAPRRFEALRDIATDTNTDSFVRSMAAEALGQLGDTSTETLQALRDIATDTNTDSNVRRFAAQALGQLGDTSTETLRGVARHRYRHQHRQQRSPLRCPGVGPTRRHQHRDASGVARHRYRHQHRQLRSPLRCPGVGPTRRHQHSRRGVARHRYRHQHRQQRSQLRCPGVGPTRRHQHSRRGVARHRYRHQHRQLRSQLRCRGVGPTRRHQHRDASGVARHRYRHQHRQLRSQHGCRGVGPTRRHQHRDASRRCETSLPTPTPTATFAAWLPRRWANSATPAPSRFEALRDIATDTNTDSNVRIFAAQALGQLGQLRPPHKRISTTTT